MLGTIYVPANQPCRSLPAADEHPKVPDRGGRHHSWHGLRYAVHSLQQPGWQNAVIPYKPEPPFKHYRAFTDGEGTVVLVLLQDETKVQGIEHSDNSNPEPSKMIEQYGIEK